MKVYLNALGLVTPLGRDKDEVAGNLFKGSRAGLIERTDFLPERTIYIGTVPWTLPELPADLEHLDCRNNRLTLAALQQIAEPIKNIVSRAGPHRVASVMGTSTSGIAEGEEALASRLERGIWPSGFRYSRQEVGSLATFVSDYFGLAGPAYTITTACSSSARRWLRPSV